MLKFNFSKKCPNCASKLIAVTEGCGLYDCGGKISVTGHYGDVITFVFKNCLAEDSASLKKRLSTSSYKNEEKPKKPNKEEPLGE